MTLSWLLLVWDNISERKGQSLLFYLNGRLLIVGSLSFFSCKRAGGSLL